MSGTELLKKLLPGFIPLFVFIAADAIWGTKTGLFVAVGVGLLEMIWIAAREKRLDKFILFDTLLMIIKILMYIPTKLLKPGSGQKIRLKNNWDSMCLRPISSISLYC